MTTKKTLVHTCCAPCAAYVYEKLLADHFEPVLYFYNPNIHPISEYERRLKELIRFCELKNIELIIEKPDVDTWFLNTEGLENEPEKGMRCNVCFEMRLQKTALKAKEMNINLFSTVLTISPHKNSIKINEIGNKISKKLNIAFLEEDFKKNEGFKKSLEKSKELNLFRQTYCGCKYSMRVEKV